MHKRLAYVTLYILGYFRSFLELTRKYKPLQIDVDILASFIQSFSPTIIAVLNQRKINVDETFEEFCKDITEK